MTVFAFLLALALLALVILLFRQKTALNSEVGRLIQSSRAQSEKLKSLGDELTQRVQELAAARVRVETLARFQGVADVDAEMAKLRVEGEAVLAEARAEAERLKAAAKEERSASAKATKEDRAAAQDKIQELLRQAERTISGANEEAARIAERAKVRAEEIAGEAYRALEEHEELNRQITAIKNTIEGYGQSYLVPSRSLLDDLAADFGHTEAGERLRMAREATKAMVTSRRAAACDYKESNRQDTAISFVIDAFNGRCDSILSRTKHDNVGKLEQEMRDAYTLVNSHGSAFRNARILESYLHARIEELRWGTVVQEIKERDREQQRAIKEKMREEEKARKEIERAIAESNREEEIVRKAMEKARKDYEAADGEAKTKWEAKLAELQGKLTAAEEKNQRALSMAQQTRMGNVYIISNVGSFGENIYKIGMTRRLEPMDRIKELGDASVPFEFDVHAMINADDAPKLEHDLHRHFLRAQVNKVNPRKEFFRLAIADIKAMVEQMGHNAQWTMTAAATEYRETLALEARLAADENAAKSWERQQEKEADQIAQEEEGAGKG